MVVKEVPQDSQETRNRHEQTTYNESAPSDEFTTDSGKSDNKEQSCNTETFEELYKTLGETTYPLYHINTIENTSSDEQSYAFDEKSDSEEPAPEQINDSYTENEIPPLMHDAFNGGLLINGKKNEIPDDDSVTSLYIEDDMDRKEKENIPFDEPMPSPLPENLNSEPKTQQNGGDNTKETDAELSSDFLKKRELSEDNVNIPDIKNDPREEEKKDNTTTEVSPLETQESNDDESQGKSSTKVDEGQPRKTCCDWLFNFKRPRNKSNDHRSSIYNDSDDSRNNHRKVPVTIKTRKGKVSRL